MLLLALLAALVAPMFLAATSDSSPATPPAPAGRASLAITSLQPLSVSGRGFQASERVTVRFQSRRRVTTATGSGRFVVRFPGIDCNGGAVVAVGSKGSRAVANYSQLLCVAP